MQTAQRTTAYRFDLPVCGGSHQPLKRWDRPFPASVLLCFFWHKHLGDLQGLSKFKSDSDRAGLGVSWRNECARIGQFKTNLGQKSEGVGSFGTSLSAKF